MAKKFKKKICETCKKPFTPKSGGQKYCKRKNCKAPGKKRMGRPKKEIDKDVFEGLCGIQCTMDDICNVFDITRKTLERWCKDTYKDTFYTVFKQKRAGGVVSLRKTGFKLAETSAAVWIFHSKNLMGWKDQPDPVGEKPEDTAKSIRDAIADMKKATNDTD